MLQHFRLKSALILATLAVIGLLAARGLAQSPSVDTRLSAAEGRTPDPTSRVEGRGQIAAAPQDPDSYIRFARYLSSEADHAAAEEVLTEGKVKAHPSARLLVALAEVQEDRRQLAKAEATVREALALDSKSVEAHLLMGHLKFRLGMPQAGLRSYRLAHDLAPTEPEPQVRLVEGMLDNALVVQAEDQCLVFLSQNGENTDLWLVLGKVFEEQEKLREAFTTYGQVMTLDPDNDEAAARQGRLFCRFGQYEAARSSCERALELNPDNLIAHAYLGIASSRLGDDETARQHARIAEAGGLNMTSVWEELGK